METHRSKSIAGMSLGGGRKENFFFCLLEFFPDKKRWFLTSLRQVRDEEEMDRDEAITSWVDNYKLHRLVVDFPLTKPMCESCQLDCPGTAACSHPVVENVRSQMKSLLEEDSELVDKNPKRYEQNRNEDDLVHHTRSALYKETHAHILSKPFKRKLKKGFLPYWNRPIDFWIWKYYYDQILSLFNISYDSFGNVSVMLMHRFHYLRRHLPRDLSMYESSSHIVLIELYRSKIISKKNLAELDDMDMAPLARVQISKAIEKKLGVFIYEKDLELIAKNPKAFDSFLLALAGQSLLKGKVKDIPCFEDKQDPMFLAPSFESK